MEVVLLLSDMQSHHMPLYCSSQNCFKPAHVQDSRSILPCMDGFCRISQILGNSHFTKAIPSIADDLTLLCLTSYPWHCCWRQRDLLCPAPCLLCLLQSLARAEKDPQPRLVSSSLSLVYPTCFTFTDLHLEVHRQK